MGNKVYENLAVKSYNMFLLSILLEPKKLQADFCRHNARHVHVRLPRVTSPTRPMTVHSVISGALLSTESITLLIPASSTS